MKRTIAILLTAVMVLSLCACGGGKTGTSASVAEANKLIYIEDCGFDNFPSPENIEGLDFYGIDNTAGKKYQYNLPEESEDAATSVTDYLALLETCGFKYESLEKYPNIFYITYEDEAAAIMGTFPGEGGLILQITEPKADK